MGTTLQAAIKQVVVYLDDGTTLTVDVDPGTKLEGVVFNRGLAEKCPGPHGQWPPKGVHFHTSTGALSATQPAATADSTTVMTMDAPPPPPPPGCYLVDGVIYCP